jgi:hypothetical protein
MKTLCKLSSVVILAVMFIGCNTSMKLKLPPDTELLVRGERVSLASKDKDGFSEYTTRPFFWTSLDGIEYNIMQGDKVLKQGKLPARFRVISIFFPPYGFIYWPLGFDLACSDLTKDIIEECRPLKTAATGNVRPADSPDKQVVK